jgi:hypothetical protein
MRRTPSKTHTIVCTTLLWGLSSAIEPPLKIFFFLSLSLSKLMPWLYPQYLLCPFMLGGYSTQGWIYLRGCRGWRPYLNFFFFFFFFFFFKFHILLFQKFSQPIAQPPILKTQPLQKLAQPITRAKKKKRKNIKSPPNYQPFTI